MTGCVIQRIETVRTRPSRLSEASRQQDSLVYRGLSGFKTQKHRSTEWKVRATLLVFSLRFSCMSDIFLGGTCPYIGCPQAESIEGHVYTCVENVHVYDMGVGLVL